MTHVARHENFIDVAAGKTELPEGEMPGLKRRVDADIIHVVRQRLQLPARKGKTPMSRCSRTFYFYRIQSGCSGIENRWGRS